MNELVLCLHSFASSGRQFRGLGQRLAPRLRVEAPDVGTGAEMPEGAAHVVGHSYGGSLALRIAAEGRTRSLVLYEPTLWGTLAHRAVHWLAESLPCARLVEIEGAGHMGPLTHAARVEAEIESFLLSERTPQWAHS